MQLTEKISYKLVLFTHNVDLSFRNIFKFCAIICLGIQVLSILTYIYFKLSYPYIINN
jgi:hypothetical protein